MKNIYKRENICKREGMYKRECMICVKEEDSSNTPPLPYLGLGNIPPVSSKQVGSAMMNNLKPRP